MTLFSFLRAASIVGAVLAGAVAVGAQTPPARTLTGTVALDGAPVAQVPVTLHRVTPAESGSLGSTVAGDDGSFSFPLPPADSARFEVFFVTAEHLGVRYFGPAVHGGVIPEAYRVVVFDTTSNLPGAIRVVRRDVVLLPDPQGGWEANEIIRLRNDADMTLVPDAGMSTWEMRLPEGVTDFQAGEGELTASEIVQMGDRVMLVTALVPGERELYMRYRVPAALAGAALAIDTPTDTMHVFLGQPSPAIEVSGLETTRVVEVEGERFVQYGTTDLEGGSEIALRWDPPQGPPLSPELAGALAAALILLAGTAFAVRSRASVREETVPPAATG